MKRILASLILIVYGAGWCGYCQLQIQELNRQGIPYMYLDIVQGGNGSIPLLENAKGEFHTGYLEGDELRNFAGE